jgi:hypothetical protein
MTVPVFSLALAAMMVVFPGSPQIYGPPAPTPRSVPGLRGQLSRSQAKHLGREAGEIRRLQDRYARDGLTDQEQAELQNRVEVLKAITNAKRIGRIN